MDRFKLVKVINLLFSHFYLGALIAFTQLAVISGKPSEPFLVPLLPMILDKMADKVAVVRKQAITTGLAIISLISPMGVPLVLPWLFAAMDGAGKWQTQQGACVLLKSLVPRCSDQIHVLMPEIVPRLSECIWNIRTEVNQAANETMLQLCKVIGNPDVESVRGIF
jgi:elongation factor 3